MTYKDNTPTYNVNRKVANFGDFTSNIEAEKENLKKVKRSFQPNSDRQNFPSNTRNEFDPITRKITSFTEDEVDDRIKSVEELEEVVGFKISDQNKKLVNDFNLEYNELTQEERDEVILNAINILNDDKLEYAGKHRLIKWENGWNENLELLKENKNPNVLIPKYFNKYNIARWRGKYVKAIITGYFSRYLST